ncbi:MAG: hypothetical protein OXR66_04155 [Candidatus Woesearchaeota archaeon]|nr:hypothetical protein [Candidatus Woesearchaeota archaeon]
MKRYWIIPLTLLLIGLGYFALQDTPTTLAVFEPEEPTRNIREIDRGVLQEDDRGPRRERTDRIQRRADTPRHDWGSGGSGGRGTKAEKRNVRQLTRFLNHLGITFPRNRIGYVDSALNLTFNNTDAERCTAYINTVPMYTKANVSNGTNIFTLQHLQPGKYIIDIICTYKDEELTRSVEFAVIKATRFKTTPFHKQDVSAMEDLFIEDEAYGKVTFINPVDLTDGADVNKHVSFENNFISINTTGVPALNTSARVVLYNITNVRHPAIYRDGELCTDCTIESFQQGELTFIVPHFSSYTSGPNAQLEIFDTTDTTPVQAEQNITFYANYTNITSNAPITGATCNVTFSDSGPHTMVYNGAMYEYNRSFSSAGAHFFTVECSEPSFEFLSTSDSASVSNENGPVAPASLNILGSSRRQGASPAALAVRGGNVTDLNLSVVQITNTWQGLYGNVTGDIILQNSLQHTFYNWTLANLTGEVYASRALDVNFPSVACALPANIATEDSFLGSTGAADSVNNTFNQTTHPTFSVGIVSITNDTCPSTNVFGSAGQDSTQYYEMLLVDGANKTLYTSILQPDTAGFNTNVNDFEILVPTRAEALETYYIWIELG